MKKSSTQKLFKSKEKVVVPSGNTIDFLKQFARSYYVDKSLPDALNGLLVN
jgi:hypothetical protein